MCVCALVCAFLPGIPLETSRLHQDQFSRQAMSAMDRTFIPPPGPVTTWMDTAYVQLIQQRSYHQIRPHGGVHCIDPQHRHESSQKEHPVFSNISEYSTICFQQYCCTRRSFAGPSNCKSFVIGALHVGHTGSQVSTARSMQLRQKTSDSDGVCSPHKT